MANIITPISYANTFGDWVTTTDGLVTEINTLGTGNYVKNSGLLTLSGSGTGLQVANNAVVQGNLVVSGTGTALQVSHDAIISGNLIVMGNTTISGFEIDYGDITSESIHVTTLSAGTANVNTYLTVGADATITGNLTVMGETNISLDEIVAGSITANALYGQANTQITQQISDSANSSVGTALAFSIALG
jgi:hypothetical protein